MKHLLTIETPDRSATVDYLTFHPETGIKVDGVNVKLALGYDKQKQEAKLFICVQEDISAKILLDTALEVSVYEEEDEDESDGSDE